MLVDNLLDSPNDSMIKEEEEYYDIENIDTNTVYTKKFQEESKTNIEIERSENNNITPSNFIKLMTILEKENADNSEVLTQ